MTIESFSLVEHFDYMRNFIPKPFIISPSEVKEISKTDGENGPEYFISSTKGKFTLTKQSIKKLVTNLGIKNKLLESVCSETDVFDLAMPIINKLFKCFADCFVFYMDPNDSLNIIDVNMNQERGPEGTKYENGPSPWKYDIKKNPHAFTCFNDFMNSYDISANSPIQVKADNFISSSGNVSFNLFISMAESRLQPMLTFSSKFSNMSGFKDIKPSIYDSDTDITISFPMNYGNSSEAMSFDDMWKKVNHVYSTTDLNDFIFNEVNELASSNETPGAVLNFISAILSNSTLNLNQPINSILSECNSVTSGMRQSKVKSFKKSLGNLIGWCLLMKHSGCTSCGHLDISRCDS